MKLKETLQMPITDFKMKGNLSNREPQFQKEWKEQKIYQQIMKKNKDKKLFILHDGPPYANGDIHLGHALNKILKDFIIRSKNANGYLAPMINGWDTHGLPIENALLKKGKIKRNELSDIEFRKKCEEYARKQVDNQAQQLSTLGLLSDPDNKYLTLDKSFEASQIKVFSKMVKKGLIYKGLKPVYWSPTSQSALAEAEIEYYDKVSPAIHVAMDLIDFEIENTQVVIWTTTPWTIPANMGVAVGENIEYSVIKTKTKNFMVASELKSNFFFLFLEKEIYGDEFEVIKTYIGEELEGVNIRHPLFNERITKIMIGHHVTTESGTGCVHIAPGHGEDDFLIGKKYNLELFSIVDAFGKMNDNAGEYSGLFYEEANKVIGEKLEETGNLLDLNFIKHSYPHDWRTKKPVLFRATAQWFCNIKLVKEEILQAIKNVDYNEQWAEVRLYNMIDGRDEWCISRQRKWGVPIPIFYTQKEEPILDEELINHVAELFAKYGSNIWFEKTAKELLPINYSHPDSPDGIFTKENDIMDVWFDSGTSHSGVVHEKFGVKQADLYLEGSDQYRGWFNSSMITGYIANGYAPYKKLISHGFTLDGKGNKMSKSIGNTISPKQITTSSGADILRMWVASVDYGSDVRVSNEIILQVSEMYRRYRNTIKFLHGTINGFTQPIEINKLEDVDKFMLMKLDNVISQAIISYENYEFKKVLDIVNNYITDELSAFYMDFIKDVTYVDEKNSIRRRQILTVIDIHLDALLKIMMPIIPHTTYEGYMIYKNENIFLMDFPNVNIIYDEKIMNLYTEFLEIRRDINKVIEDVRNNKIIGKSLEAIVKIKPNNKVRAILDQIKDLDLLCIVSMFEVVDEELDGVITDSGTILVEKYNGDECLRCRKYYQVGTLQTVQLDEEYQLCSRCLEVVNSYL